jgi:hypothetical protein
MSNICSSNPSADFPAVQFYSIDQGKLICDKLWVVVCIFMEMIQSKDHMREMTNHPIHQCTKNLCDMTASQTVAVGELEYINWALQEVTSDLNNSGDAWVKERVSTALSVMSEAVGGNYTIESSIYKEFF